MARPSKPAAVIEYEKKSHRTKAEIKKRKQEEEKLLTGEELKEREEVKADKIAHKEFLRIRNLLKKIEKNDGLYCGVINRYAQLYSECLEFEKKRETFFQRIRELEEKGNELIEKGDMTVPEYFKMQCELEKQVVALDKQVQSKRKMMLELEKENVMTIASALRNIPKKEDEKDDPLLQILKGSG